MAPNQLGCGQYTAQLWTRGGGSVLLTDVPFAGGSWSRVLDDTSAASIDMVGLGRSAKCFKAIRNGRPFEHELALARNGKVVWQGPANSKNANGTKGSYDARDLSAWWDRRKLPVDREYVAVDVATIFQQLATDAMTEDPSPGITVSTTPTGILAARKYLAGQNLIAGDQLRELSKAGVDWTVVARTVLAGGLVVPADPIVLLQDTHIVGAPNVNVDGVPMANRVTVRGAGGGEGADPIVGVCRDEASIAQYGLIDVVVQQDSIRDAASAVAAAASKLALVSVPVPILSEVTLSQYAPVLIEQLIPGATVGCAFSSSGIEVAGTYRIAKVTVAIKGKGEDVTLTLQPLGAGG